MVFIKKVIIIFVLLVTCSVKVFFYFTPDVEVFVSQSLCAISDLYTSVYFQIYLSRGNVHEKSVQG